MDFSKFTNVGNHKPNAVENIPAGTLLLVRMDYKPGGKDLPGTPPEMISGALTASKSSDVLYLNAEFTVLEGPYKGRKIFEMFSLHGGELNEQGESKAAIIAMGKIREIVDAARGLSLKDETPEAMQKRQLTKGFRDFAGMTFLCKAGIAKGNNGYADKNKLGSILHKDHRDFTTDMNVIRNAGVVAAKAPVAAPSWAGGAPAAAPAAPLTVVAPSTPFGGAQTVAAPAASAPSAATPAAPTTDTPAPAVAATPAIADPAAPAWYNS